MKYFHHHIKTFGLRYAIRSWWFRWKRRTRFNWKGLAYAVRVLIHTRQRPTVILWTTDASEEDCQRYDFIAEASWSGPTYISCSALGSEITWRDEIQPTMRKIFPLHIARWRSGMVVDYEVEMGSGD